MPIISYSTSSGERTYQSVDQLIDSIHEWSGEVDGAIQANVSVSEHYVAIEYVHEEDDAGSVEMVHRSYLTESDMEQLQPFLI
jgi:hypothetical protein